MALTDALDRYLGAWNAHDGGAVAAAFVEGGAYEDPPTRGPLSGVALAANVNGLAVGLPDLHFDLDPTSDRLTKVVGYFDTALMLRQLGLQAHLSPADMDPFPKFGLGIRVGTGRSAGQPVRLNHVVVPAQGLSTELSDLGEQWL